LYPGPDGIYEGALTNSASPQGTAVVAIIAANGTGRIAGADGSYYRLSVGSSGNNLNGSYSGYPQVAALSAGASPVSAQGSVAGTITPNGLNLQMTDNTNTQQSVALTFDNVYNRSSALANLAGSWTSTANGLTLTATIQPDGSFSAVDSNNCTYLGSFSLLDPTFDVYAETHVRSCNGAAITFTGLAALLLTKSTTGSGSELELLTDTSGGDYLVADFQ
jgi:hypothetical protein